MLEFGKASPRKKINLHYVVDELETYGLNGTFKPHRKRSIEFANVCQNLIQEGAFYVLLLLLYHELSLLPEGQWRPKVVKEFSPSKKLHSYLFQTNSILSTTYSADTVRIAPKRSFFNKKYIKVLLKILMNINGNCPFEKFRLNNEIKPLQCFLLEEIGYFKFLLESVTLNDCDNRLFYCALQCTYNLFLIRDYIIARKLKTKVLNQNVNYYFDQGIKEKLYDFMASTIVRRNRSDELLRRIDLLSKKKVKKEKIITALVDRSQKNYMADLDTHLTLFVKALKKHV